MVHGSYQSFETRRSCARLVANLSARQSSVIAKYLGAEKLNEWIRSIENIHDSKLRVHADRARIALQEAATVA
jgi:hypothetical protein